MAWIHRTFRLFLLSILLTCNNRLFRLIYLCLTLLLFSPQLFAAPWLNSGDERSRHHLQALIDSGVISTPITTWPMMWTNVKNALDVIDPTKLTANQLWSYQYIKHELRRNTKKVAMDKQIYLGNNAVALSNFATDSREAIQARFGINYLGDSTAFRVQTNFAHDPSDDQEFNLDGSYLTSLLGNWAFGIGAIDRWWGPGWQASMILSNNARPIPGIFLQRNRATAFKTPILNWLGPWQLTTFMGQMESNRDDYARPRLWGMRLNFRPLDSLEIGMSRTAMWAGKGRPGDADTFLNLLIGRDNRGDDGTTAENEPGNQLGGFDARWNYSFQDFNVATYAQIIGEDEAGGLPSRHIGMAGIEVQSLWKETHWRMVLEAHNSQMSFYDSKGTSNSAYEHTIYSDGYRYRNRTLGASTDNDTESVTLKTFAYYSNGHALNLSLSHIRINFDGTSNKHYKSPFGSNAVTTYELKASYSLPLSNHYSATLGGFYFSKDIHFQNENINLGGYLQLNARW